MNLSESFSSKRKLVSVTNVFEEVDCDKLYRVWRFDGTFYLTGGLRSVSARTSEPSEVLKVEEVLSPNRRRVKSENTMVLILPYNIVKKICEVPKITMSKEVLVSFCKANVELTWHGMEKFFFKSLVEFLEKSNKEFFILDFISEESFSDYVVLSLLREGETSVEEYKKVLLNCNWGWNISIRAKELAQIKHSFIQTFTEEGTEEEFVKIIEQVRHTLFEPA